MGTLISAVCESCGYRKDTMALFGGMIGFLDTCMIPYYCESCNTLFEGNMLEDDIFCSECGNDNVFSYEDQRAGFSGEKESFSWHVMELEREVKLNEEGNLCPQCGEFSLAFEDAGCWD
jgi:hypothetical protein